MELWRKVFREGLVPLLSERDLEVALIGLQTDDQRIIQGATTSPPPLKCCEDWPCEKGDLITFIAMESRGMETVKDCENFFAETMFSIDKRLGEPAANRYWNNWYDDTPRDVVRLEVMGELRRAIAEREEEVVEVEWME